MAIYLAGLLLIAAVSWAVAAPFFRRGVGHAGSLVTDEPNRWQKQKDEALAVIRDAEFDFHLGKLSEADYRELRRRFEGRALEAMEVLEGRRS